MGITEVDAALGNARRALLDSSALIAFHSHIEAVHPLARHVLERIERRDDPLTGCYSVVSASEILVRPMRAGTASFALMHAFLQNFPNLTALPIDLAVAVKAASLRATAGVRLPDALIVASGLFAGCDAVVSNDEQWQRRLAPLVHDVRWIYLGDFLP